MVEGLGPYPELLPHALTLPSVGMVGVRPVRGRRSTGAWGKKASHCAVMTSIAYSNTPCSGNPGQEGARSSPTDRRLHHVTQQTPRRQGFGASVFVFTHVHSHTHYLTSIPSSSFSPTSFPLLHSRSHSHLFLPSHLPPLTPHSPILTPHVAHIHTHITSPGATQTRTINMKESEKRKDIMIMPPS